MEHFIIIPIFAATSIVVNKLKPKTDMKQIIITIFLLFANIMGTSAQEGAWSGILDLGDRKLPLVFHFDAEGCYVDFLAQHQKLKANKSYTEDGKLKVAVPGANLTFIGVVSKEADLIVGNIIQGDSSNPFTLKRGEAEVKLNRPQTPKEPFPYKTEEVAFQNGKFTLHGTLSLPENCSARTPVVLFVTRMGQQDRDETNYDHKTFAVIADALARNGIASLRYDDRCLGDTVDFYNSFTTYDLKDDASAGLKFLRKRFKKVGIIGHHFGGTIALMLAAESKADFVVSLAGIAVEFKKNLLWQNSVALESQGYSQDEIKQFSVACFLAYENISEGKPVEPVNVSVSDKLQPWLEWNIKQVSKPYFKSLFSVDIPSLLPKIKCPVLALNGKMDNEVDCRSNLSILEEGLTASKHKIMALDGLNNLFQYSSTGIVGDYALIEETFAPEILQIIIDWIKEQKK